MTDRKTYFTIKGSLSTGKIREFVGKQFSKFDNVYCLRDDERVNLFDGHKLGKEAFEDRAEAVAAAFAARDKKIASLEKQISKLRKMTFAP